MTTPETNESDYPALVEELQSTIAAVKADREQIRADRDRWRDARRQDDEAEALDGCVRALDKLGGTKTYDYGRPMAGNQYERILRFLAARYGVTWPEPCRHRDVEQDAEVLLRLEGQVRSIAEQISSQIAQQVAAGRPRR